LLCCSVALVWVLWCWCLCGVLGWGCFCGFFLGLVWLCVLRFIGVCGLTGEGGWRGGIWVVL